MLNIGYRHPILRIVQPPDIVGESLHPRLSGFTLGQQASDCASNEHGVIYQENVGVRSIYSRHLLISEEDLERQVTAFEEDIVGELIN